MKRILAATLLTLTCIHANAGGDYLGMSYGQAQISIVDTEVAVHTFTKDEEGNSYKIFWGRDINEYLSAEGGLQVFKGASAVVDYSGTGTLQSDYTADSFFVDVIGKYSVLDSLALLAKWVSPEQK